MPKVTPARFGCVVFMTPKERSEHIAYYRERLRELRHMDGWIGPSETKARASISTRLIALERTVALLDNSES